MPIYYCHNCAIMLGLVIPVDPITLTGTTYQFGKYVKHTAPASGTYSFVSVYNTKEYQDIADLIVTTKMSGCLEVDDQGRKNLIWYLGSGIGVTYQDDRPIEIPDAVKVVFPEDDQKLHSYPITGSGIITQSCVACGKAVFS